MGVCLHLKTSYPGLKMSHLFHPHITLKIQILSQNKFGNRFGRPLILLTFCRFPLIQNHKNHSQNPKSPRKINTFPNSPKNFIYNKETAHKIHSKIILLNLKISSKITAFHYLKPSQNYSHTEPT